MTALRSVDPRDLKANPDNPRTIAASPAMDAQLVASIRAIGIIQPPVVRDLDGILVIKAGHRRVKAAITAGLATIDVLVKDGEDGTVAMESLSENLVRAAMNNVEIWRAIERLEGQGWNEQAIADALAQPVRTVRRLKLLAHLHPPLLDDMARGNMPNEDQLRTIASASIEEQVQVWKKHKPKKNESTSWWAIASALSKRRIPFSAAKFDDDLATKYGVTWHDDLFAPADEESCYTTDADGFLGAQQEWLENNLPKGGVLVPQDDYGQPALPKKAERVYGKPGKGDILGHFLDPRTAEVKTVAYRLPADKKAGKGKGEDANPIEAPEKAQRPDVTQKGRAIIGDLRTDALHEALLTHDIDDATLIALLVIALGARNVSVQSGVNDGRFDREAMCDPLMEGGVLTADHAVIRYAARKMLAATLSCRDNMSNSGIGARVAGKTIGATLRLASMASDGFLSCLSRQALEREATANGVRVEARVKDTRAGIVRHFEGATWLYPDAIFALSKLEIEGGIAETGHWVPGVGGTDPDEEMGEADPMAAADDLGEGGDPIEFADAAD